MTTATIELPLTFETLPACRHRGRALGDGRAACTSTKVHAPRGVSLHTCATCAIRDHAPTPAIQREPARHGGGGPMIVSALSPSAPNSQRSPPVAAPRLADLECVHRGERIQGGRVRCGRGCGGQKEAQLYACAKFGQCTLGLKADGVACCATCAERVPPAPPPPPPQIAHGVALSIDDEPAFLAAKLRSIPPLPKSVVATVARWPNAQRAFQLIADEFIATMPDAPPHVWSGRGAVVCGGGKYFTSAYVICGVLRHLGWTHPIQLWHFDGEVADWQRPALAGLDVEPVNAHAVAKIHPARILNGWELKPFAVYHSSLAEVLYLDADSYPVRNPDYLFDGDGYRRTGAIFTPDSGRYTLRPEQWALFGMEHRDEWAFESGQFVIDKPRWWRGLRLAMHYCDWSDFTFELIYGDKDTYHVAARKLGLEYTLSPRRPGGGRWGLLQHDPDGKPLFVHRIHAKFTLPGDARKFISGQRAGDPHDLPLNDVIRQLLRNLEAMKPAAVAT